MSEEYCPACKKPYQEMLDRNGLVKALAASAKQVIEQEIVIHKQQRMIEMAVERLKLLLAMPFVDLLDGVHDWPYSEHARVDGILEDIVNILEGKPEEYEIINFHN